MSSNIKKIQNFVFRGMLLDASFGVLADSGLEVRGNIGQKESEDKDLITLEDFPSDLRINAIRMASVYTAFFCFENSVRKLVSQRLKERVGTDWWNKSVSSNIRKTVRSRMDEDKKNKWHSPRADSEICYCDFGDLCNIITNNWPNFEDLFPSQDWIKTRLNDLEPSRNTIAHNNPLFENDIKRIDMFLRDWILQVG